MKYYFLSIAELRIYGYIHVEEHTVFLYLKLFFYLHCHSLTMVIFKLDVVGTYISLFDIIIFRPVEVVLQSS